MNHNSDEKQNKRDETISLACCKKITVAKCAEILGISPRQVIRLKQDYQNQIPLTHKLRGRPSNHRKDEEVKANVLNLIEKQYSDFGPTFLAETLHDEHGIDISHETSRKWMSAAGFWLPTERREKHRQWRPRRSCLGELVQMDTSVHDWFQGRGKVGKFYLISMIDDATSRQYAHFFSADSTVTNMTTIRNYINLYGRPQALYTDRASHFKVNRAIDASSEENPPETQIQRALEELGINIIFAKSPQAKGRVERSYRTIQDRLVKLMRVNNITTIEEANNFLDKKFLPNWNKRFTVAPASDVDLHRDASKIDLGSILCIKINRTVRNDFTFDLFKQKYQIAKDRNRSGLKTSQVEIEIWLNNTIKAKFKGKYLYISPINTKVKGKGDLYKTIPALSAPAPAKAMLWEEPN